jgi:two-component system nitrate/nitrite response regulator NarL
MNTQRIKLAIIDDAPILSNGLLFMLQGYSNLEVVTNTTTTEDLLHRMQQHPVDILLVDILRYMRGDQLGRKVKERFPLVKILVLSLNNHNKAMAEFVMSDKHVADSADTCELVTALERLAVGGGYYSKNLAGANGRQLMRRKSYREDNLTDRELEVIRLIEREFNNRQIAHTLFISERTVETHRKHIYQKTCTNNVIALIKYAYSHKLVE